MKPRDRIQDDLSGKGAVLIQSSLSTPLRNAASQAQGSYTDIVSSLRSLPELARLVADADFGAVTVLNSRGVVTAMIYAGITGKQASSIGDPPTGEGLLGRLGEADSPLRLGRMAEHPESAGFPPNHPEMEALIGVRVTSSGDTAANLYVARRPGRGDFSAEDEAKISALAAYARIALDNAHLYEHERDQRASAEAAEQRLTAVIRGSAAGVVVKDASNGRFVQVSGEAHRITGIDFGDMESLGDHPFEKLYHQPDGTPMQSDEIPLNIALGTGRPAGPEDVLFIRPDGTRVPVLVTAAPVFNFYGELDSAVCVFVDLSQVKELEQAKDDFLSMITHDLRTPLATIKGMADAALNAAHRSDTDAAISFLSPIDDEVDYLAELVSNLLDMTRIEAGGDVFDMEVCHLADITQDSLARMGRTREAAQRDIHSNVAPDLPNIYADPGQIGRVIDNLVSNALKYSDNGIGITARYVEGEDTVRVEVEDRGPGIPSGQEKIIFDRFARLKGAERSGRQGSGLGLAICKSIINAHSGEIGVESNGTGAVFWFTLPLDTGGS